jgi:ribosome maturation factor RimP
MDDETLNKIEDCVSPILLNLGYTLIDREFLVEHGQLILRLYIDKPEGGVTVNDCERASRAIEDMLDAENFIDSPYNLEVSSPGLDRPLKSARDFENHCGKMVRLKTSEPIEGRSNYKGRLEAVREGCVFVFIDGMVYRVPIDKISKARLVPEF